MRSLTDDQLREKLERYTMPIPWSGCWLWMKGLDKDGYGQASRQNKNIRAHRLSWLLNRGELKQGFVIMHSCDTPACCNPAHLSQALQIENNNDKMRKKRHRVASGDDHYLKRNPEARSGEKSNWAKVTNAQAAIIRDRFAAGEMQKTLAAEFGITRSAISGIVTRRTFIHI